MKRGLNGPSRVVIALLLFACSSTQKVELKEFDSRFSEGPCDFGKLPLEKDPELPNSGFIPTVFCKSEEEAFVSLGREWMDYDWTQVYYDGDKRYVTILDWAIEGGFTVVPVLESKDLGKTWETISRIEKPHFSARIIKLSFDNAGNGELHMEWEPDKIVVTKLYSKDNGKTWQAPSEEDPSTSSN